MTLQQEWFDAQVRRQIDLFRFGSGVTKRINELLTATHGELKALIERRLSKGARLDGPNLRRLGELERAIDQRRSGAWNDVRELWTRTAVDVVLDEPEFMGSTLKRILPVELDLVMPAERTLRALVTTRPFQGKHLREWAKGAEASDRARIQQQIRIGMAMGESARDIASRVFGARGAALKTLSEAEAVTRTVINHVSNAAQQEFLGENADLFDDEMIVATLDGRTTLLCAGLDGKRFAHGQGPIPPLHVRCRTIRVGLLNGEVIGERPFVAATEQQMLREYAAQNGLEPITKASALPRGHKGAYERFRRARMRELTGQVPAKTTFEDFLRRQSPEWQDDYLGPARAKLFREGGLKLEKFTSRTGEELTLDQLRERYRSAWSKAGLDQPPAAPTVVRETALATLTKTLESAGDVSDVHRAAAERGFRRVGAGRGTQPLPERVVMTSLLGRRDTELPLATGGTYSRSGAQIKLSTNPQTLRLFLREVDLASEMAGNTQNIAKDIDEVLEMTAAHEYAHHIHLSGLVRAQVLGGKDAADMLIEASFADRERQLVSRYAAWNHAEYWAESLVAYHYYPRDWLAANAPKVVTLVENVLRLKGLL